MANSFLPVYIQSGPKQEGEFLQGQGLFCEFSAASLMVDHLHERHCSHRKIFRRDEIDEPRVFQVRL
jgi:hypothetical protein